MLVGYPSFSELHLPSSTHHPRTVRRTLGYPRVDGCSWATCLQAAGLRFAVAIEARPGSQKEHVQENDGQYAECDPRKR